MHLASDQKDLLISQLKAEIFEIEQRDKDYLALRDQLYSLQTKYRHLQDEKLLQDNDFKTRHDSNVMTLQSLKKEIEKAWKMVDTAQEGEERARETIETLNTEIQNLTKVIEEKTLGAEDTNINELRKLRDELTQQRDNLQLEVAELKTKFEANEAKVETLTKEKADQVKVAEMKKSYLHTHLNIFSNRSARLAS